MEGNKLQIIFCLLLIGCLSNQALAKPRSSKSEVSVEDDYPNDYGNPDDYNDNESESEPEVVVKPRVPPVLIKPGGSVRGMIGVPLSLPCNIESNDWIVIWNKKNQSGPISLEDTSYNPHYQIKEKHTLYIQSPDIYDNDDFSCEVKYSQNNVEQVMKVVHSVSLDSPAEITAIRPLKQLVDEFSALEIICDVSGHPKPEVEWYKADTFQQDKNVRITEEVAEEWGIKINYNILSIPKVNHHHHSGKYHCLADNKIAGNNKLGHSNYSQISVLHKPDVIVQSHAYNSEEGHNIDIHCTVISNPDAKQGWFFKDEIQPLKTDDIENNHKIEVHTVKDKDNANKQHIELKIKNVTKSDLGKYICKAENKFGAVEKHVEIGPKPSIHNIQISVQPNEITFKVRSIAPLTVVEYSFARQGEKFDKWTKLPIVNPTGFDYNFAKNVTGLQKGVYVGRIIAHNSHGSTEVRLHKFVVDEDDNTPIKVAGALGTNASGAFASSLFSVVILYLITKLLH